jgi:hypothetical protein
MFLLSVVLPAYDEVFIFSTYIALQPERLTPEIEGGLQYDQNQSRKTLKIGNTQ